LPVTFTNVAAEDLQREMLLVGVPGCEDMADFENIAKSTTLNLSKS
jgi:hypothetical protein